MSIKSDDTEEHFRHCVGSKIVNHQKFQDPLSEKKYKERKKERKRKKEKSICPKITSAKWKSKVF